MQVNLGFLSEGNARVCLSHLNQMRAILLPFFEIQ